MIVIFILIGLVISGCKNQTQNQCNKDGDCMITGCSSEICSDKPVMSPCVIIPEHSCLKYAECKCINNECRWGFTQDYNECVSNISHVSPITK